MINKNIGIFSHDFFPIKGGQGTHLYSIYKELINEKYLNFLIFSPCKNDIKEHISMLKYFNKGLGKNISFSILLGLILHRIIKKFNLGIIHFHGGPGGLFLFIKPKIPVLFTCHHTYWQQYKYIPGQKWKVILYLLEKWSYKKADKIICVSNDTKAILRDKYGIKDENLIYIPNGIDLNDFDISKNIEKEQKSIVFVGRLEKRKGIEFLVNTMKTITKLDKEIILYIIGTGYLVSKLQLFVKKNKLEKNIIFLGFLSGSKLKERIQKSMIMIVPSIFEGFGISILEGMALKVPIIGTNVDGIRTIINHQKNGILVNYGDESSLADKVINLLEDNSMKNALIEKGYQDISEKYNWNQITKSTLNEYKKLAS